MVIGKFVCFTVKPTRGLVNYVYFSDVDSLKLYFVRVSAKSNYVANSEIVAPYMNADFDKSDRVVAIEIVDTAKNLPCHFYDTVGTLDNKRYVFFCIN